LRLTPFSPGRRGQGDEADKRGIQSYTEKQRPTE